MARLRTEFKTFLATFSVWMDRLGTHGKIFLVTFSLAFFALFIVHLVYLPHYWSNVSPQRRPIDLYLPSVWTPAIIFYSVLIAVFAVVTFSLLSWLRSGKAYFAGAAIFMTTLSLGALGIYVLFGLAVPWMGYPIRLDYYTRQSPKSTFAIYIFTGFFSLGSAVSTTAVFECYKLVRWARKRLKSKAEA
jgi:hypothetical protein